MSNQAIKKNPYVRHPEMKLLFRKEYIRFLLIIHIPFFAIIFFTREFPNFLATMDATIVVLAILHATVSKPMMKNGNMRAYYRRHYRTKTTGSFLSVVYTGIWFGAILRSVLLMANFMLQYFNFEKNELPSLVAGMKLNYMDLNGAILGFLLFSAFMFVLYYSDRYITIEEFSKRSTQYVKECGMTLEVAMEKVLYEQKISGKSNVTQHRKTNKAEKGTPVESLATIQASEIIQELLEESEIETEHVDAFKDQDQGDRNIIIPMRRQARR